MSAYWPPPDFTRRELLDAVKYALTVDDDIEILPALRRLIDGDFLNRGLLCTARGEYNGAIQRAERAERRMRDWRQDAEQSERLLRLFADPCSACTGEWQTLTGVCPACNDLRWVAKKTNG